MNFIKYFKIVFILIFICTSSLEYAVSYDTSSGFFDEFWTSNNKSISKLFKDDKCYNNTDFPTSKSLFESADSTIQKIVTADSLLRDNIKKIREDKSSFGDLWAKVKIGVGSSVDSKMTEVAAAEKNAKGYEDQLKASADSLEKLATQLEVHANAAYDAGLNDYNSQTDSTKKIEVNTCITNKKAEYDKVLSELKWRTIKTLAVTISSIVAFTAILIKLYKNANREKKEFTEGTSDNTDSGCNAQDPSCNGGGTTTPEVVNNSCRQSDFNCLCGNTEKPIECDSSCPLENGYPNTRCLSSKYGANYYSQGLRIMADGTIKNKNGTTISTTLTPNPSTSTNTTNSGTIATHSPNQLSITSGTLPLSTSTTPTTSLQSSSRQSGTLPANASLNKLAEPTQSELDQIAPPRANIIDNNRDLHRSNANNFDYTE